MIPYTGWGPRGEGTKGEKKGKSVSTLESGGPGSNHN